MGAVAYVNGRFVAHGSASVHIEDRGYQFADGVYEVMAVHNGHMIDLDRHMTRLDRSLGELQIAWPVSGAVLRHIMAELIRRNRLIDGIVYLQITRGVAPRDHAYPEKAKPALVLTTKRFPPFEIENLSKGVTVVTVEDIRWRRRDIKSISLLPNCMGKQVAREAGAYEAWMVEDGFVTEGTSSNAWILSAENELITRKPNRDILNGITRIDLVEVAGQMGVPVVERSFTVEEAKAAREAFVTSTTSFVRPIIKIDDTVIGDGRPGPMGRKLLEGFFDHIAKDTAAQ
ncbi:MAG: D-amino-acid transaminase [Magnetovibrionaceae bacterium]